MILIFRYVCEGMREADLLAVAAAGSVSNASVTRLLRPAGQLLWAADAFNADQHLAAQGVAVTRHPGDRDAFPR